MVSTVLRRVYNPRLRECGCDPDCWCQRTRLGRIFRWWFPGRYFGMPHKNRGIEELKRAGIDPAEWKRQQHDRGKPE
jgi:hypothetical protein